MKTNVLLVGLLLISGQSLADLTLKGPGVPAGVMATKVPFKVSYTVPKVYRFVFSGIEAKGNTLGAPGSSGTQGNGGQFHLSARINCGDFSTKEGNITFRDVQELNTAPTKQILHSPAEVVRATTVPLTLTIEWKGEGNAKKPDGHFIVLGEYQPEPTPPVGHLTFAIGDFMLTAAGSQPEGVATVIRE